MNAEQFAYWLQGFSELNGSPPTNEQWTAIQDHLKLVFDKVTPVRLGGLGAVPYCAPNAANPFNQRTHTIC